MSARMTSEYTNWVSNATARADKRRKLRSGWRAVRGFGIGLVDVVGGGAVEHGRLLEGRIFGPVFRRDE